MALAASWVEAGGTASQFASQHGVAPTTVWRWRRELEEQQNPPSEGFVELAVKSDAIPQPGVSVLVDGRHHVVVNVGFDETTLARVVRDLSNGKGTVV